MGASVGFWACACACVCVWSVEICIFGGRGWGGISGSRAVSDAGNKEEFFLENKYKWSWGGRWYAI